LKAYSRLKIHLICWKPILKLYNGIPKGNSQVKNAQHSVHLTLGILRQSQAVFYALSFFWLDGFAVPAPAQVTQTVGQFLAKRESKKGILCSGKFFLR
jgi:hypothetical protein